MSISNILIAVSAISTVFAKIEPGFYQFGINSFFLNNGIYYIFIIQFLAYQFLHGGIFHILFNSIFIYIFGNQLEALIGREKFIIFFIFNTVFVGISLLLFGTGTTIGISGFCMALITYLTLDLYKKGNLEYKGGLTAIIINIAIGLSPGISLIGHLFGSIAGALFYFLNNKKKN